MVAAVCPAMSLAPQTAVQAGGQRDRGRPAAVPRPVAGGVIATGARGAGGRGAGGRVAPAALAAPSLSGMGMGPTPVPRAG